jgi:4-hydroxybenzoate polyprenyltransferase
VTRERTAFRLLRLLRPLGIVLIVVGFLCGVTGALGSNLPLGICAILLVALGVAEVVMGTAWLRRLRTAEAGGHWAGQAD